jgi:dTDP-4-amino-4,6-dideoxygalactose transaminase
VPTHTEQAYHMYYLLLPNLELRQKFIYYLRDLGIYSVFHYLPLHLSDMGQRFGGKVGDCPVTEDFSDRLVRLPFHNGLNSSEQELTIEAILDF